MTINVNEIRTRFASMQEIEIDETLQDAFEELTGELLDIEDLNATSETLDSYRESREKYWREKGTIRIDTEFVFVVDDVQPRKGMRRGTVAVVDFGIDGQIISSFA